MLTKCALNIKKEGRKEVKRKKERKEGREGGGRRDGKGTRLHGCWVSGCEKKDFML